MGGYMTSNVEGQGITAVNDLLFSSKIFTPHLDWNDKTISWDGTIFVYKNKNNTKKNYVDRIPAQVKTVTVSKFRGNRKKKNFKKDDLENYWKDDGILIFVVEVDKSNKKKIFIASLLPSDIIRKLDEIERDGKKSASIQLENLPTDNCKVIENICHNFLLQRNKQRISKNYPPLPITEATDLVFSGITDERPLDQYLLNVPQYIYAKSSIPGVEYFVEKVNLDHLKKKITEEVIIGGEVFFDSFYMVISKNGKKFIFGNEVTFEVSENKLQIKLSGNLEEQIFTSRFILKLLQEKKVSFKIGSIELQDIGDYEKLVNQFSERQDQLKEIEALCNTLSIESKKLDLPKVTNPQYSFIKLLIDSLVYKKKITSLPFSADNTGIINLQIGNLKLGILIIKNSEGYYKVSNLFNSNDGLNFKISNGEIEIKASRYVGLKCESLITMDNLVTEVIIDDIMSIDYSKDYGDVVNLLVLEFIKAFDESNDQKFLNSGLKLLEWILSQTPDDKICRLNKYQILRRLKGNLAKDEIEDIRAMKQNADSKTLCGISIMLENKADVNYYFNQLSEDVKKEFLDYPIYTLAQKIDLI